MKDLIPLILAAVVLATVMAAVLVVVRYRDRRPIRSLVIPIAGTWAIFLALAWIAVLIPGSGEAIIFVAAAMVAGVGMLAYTRRASSPRANLVDRPEFWALVVVGSAVGVVLLLLTNR